MNYLTQQLLNSEELEILREKLDKNSEISKKYTQLIANKISANSLIKSFALPKKIHGMMFTKSSKNMKYGRHIDNPFMSSGRSDLSFNPIGTSFSKDFESTL